MVAVGEQVALYNYDAYGNLKKGAADDQPFLYTGRRYDAETGLYYYRARYYSSELGRFLQTDPVGYEDSMNMYAYGNNDPLNGTDPTGKFWGLASKIIKVAIKGGDIAATVAGAIDDIKTLTDSNASIGERALAGLSLVSEVFSPVSVRDVGAGVDAIKAFNKADNAKDGAKATDTATDAVKQADCPLSCFVAGTRILTDDGYADIETLKQGDLVWAHDPDTGETSLKPIVRTFVNTKDVVWHLELTDADGKAHLHQVTGSHPYYVVGKGFITVDDLAVGMVIETKDDRNVRVTSLINTGEVVTTYNFEVADIHTYYVGTAQVLVHNCGVSNVSDSTVVCRGGQCGADNFTNGSGVTTDPDTGKLSGVSTGIGDTVEEASQNLRHNQVGVTTAGDIRAAGGTIVNDRGNHATVSGITAEQAAELFKEKVKNPNKR